MDGLAAAVVASGAAVPRGVTGPRRTHEVDGHLGQRAVGHVKVPVEQHRGGGAPHAQLVLLEGDRSRSLNEDSTAHARRTA